MCHFMENSHSERITSFIALEQKKCQRAKRTNASEKTRETQTTNGEILNIFFYI